MIEIAIAEVDNFKVEYLRFLSHFQTGLNLCMKGLVEVV
jgi:hypothetical protein